MKREDFAIDWLTQSIDIYCNGKWLEVSFDDFEEYLKVHEEDLVDEFTTPTPFDHGDGDVREGLHFDLYECLRYIDIGNIIENYIENNYE
jgi:hypothetical protein